MWRLLINGLLLILVIALFSQCSTSQKKDVKNKSLLPINVLDYTITSDTLEIITDSDFIWDPMTFDTINEKKNIKFITKGKSKIGVDFTKKQPLLLCAVIKDTNYKLKNNISIGLHQKEILEALKIDKKSSFINIPKFRVIVFYDPPGEEYEIYLKFDDNFVLKEIVIKRPYSTISCNKKDN